LQFRCAEYCRNGNGAIEAVVNWMPRAILRNSMLSMVIAVSAAGCSANMTARRDNSNSAEREASAAEAGRVQEHSQIEELLRRTRPNGSVRVIVQLRVPAGPDETREQRIRSVQQALLAELAPAPHKILRTYAVTPAVALEASHQALQVLRASPHVLRIDEDELAKPFNTPSDPRKAK
jgi:hypothetical protein